ncbi:MAG: gamma-glutamyltransferase [Actinobacteria bacterium]|nr:MAG: gamma-glutamyltransferase [Actinomycetota bacterium]
MRGAIAAGHQVTAETGARVLAAGGNAVDACVAAGFASWVAESTLTGPGGGGFMLVHRAHDRGARLLDFFVAVPGRGLPPHERAEMEEVDVDFDRETSQVFHIGAPSTAVPGTAAGLEAAHRAYGTLPWPELVAPAVELAREGIELTRPQAYLHAILDVILRHTEEGRRMYERDGERLVAGDRVAMPDLARTLERLADHGARELYDGELGRAIAAHVREHGGDIDERDLAEYRVIWRRPVRAAFKEHEFLSNPPPSSGGVLIAYGLRLLDRLTLEASLGSAEEIATLAEVMREQTRTRAAGFTSGLYRGGLARRLLADGEVEQGLARVRARLEGLAEPVGAPGTTQISVVDARGNAASMTASTGSGSGVIVPGTGVHLNNMLGEYDLVAASARPGMRLTSMMAPSMVLRGGLPRLVVGSAGSVRLRGAILQIVNNVVGHGLDVGEAIDRPRMHLEEPHVHCEGGSDPAEVDRLEAMGYEVTRWRRRNLYFGGAAAVEVREDGTLAAAGDPRRGGHGVVVEA